MFSDETEFHVKAGNGGKGLVSFRHEKYVPFGGPDGGDGGRGGSVIFRVIKSLRTLSHLRSRRSFQAQPGDSGGRRNKSGKDGADCIIEVPLGTIIKEKNSNLILGDLNKEHDELIVTKGGMGGRGNSRFSSSTNQSPKYAQPGIEGEENNLFIELKLIADIGLVGLPNAGKSTLLSHLSNANPKIAAYPFTTLYPNLGVVQGERYDSYIIADIPGLIEGAHKGVGLGVRFLKHIERTKGLLFMIDLYDDNPFDQFRVLLKELEGYHSNMLKKPYYIALNKADLFSDDIKKKKLNDFTTKLTEESISQNKAEPLIFLISAVSGEGLDDLKKGLLDLI